MVGVTRLQRARAAGLRVCQRDGKLLLRGPSRLGDLARELLSIKEEVLQALLDEEREAHRHAESLGQVVLRPEDFEIRTVADLSGYDSGRPPRVCYGCKRHRWWRGLHGQNWVCGHCVPPGIPPDEIEWSVER